MSDPLNPKDQVASQKAPLELVSDIACAMESLAMLNGKGKYGGVNYRGSQVRAMVYIGALKRHLLCWLNGEESDSEGVPHLGAMRACLGIIIDAQVCGTLVDDRPPACPNIAKYMADLAKTSEALVKLHADKSPKHWTIADPLGGQANGYKGTEDSSAAGKGGPRGGLLGGYPGVGQREP